MTNTRSACLSNLYKMRSKTQLTRRGSIAMLFGSKNLGVTFRFHLLPNCLSPLSVTLNNLHSCLRAQQKLLLVLAPQLTFRPYGNWAQVPTYFRIPFTRWWTRIPLVRWTAAAAIEQTFGKCISHLVLRVSQSGQCAQFSRELDNIVQKGSLKAKLESFYNRHI